MKLDLLNSMAGRVIIVISATFAAMSNIQIALIVLLVAVIADFMTGWLASYMEIKRGEKPMPNSGYSFESEKARETVSKAVGYMCLILGSLVIEYLFFDKKFEFKNLSSKQMGITELIVVFCIAIEIYSTVIENSKRAGFDIVKKVTVIIDTVWKIIKKTKGEEDNGQSNEGQN